MSFSKVDEALIHAVHSTAPGEHKKKTVTPGAVLLVGQRGSVVYHRAFGSRSIEPEVTPLSREMVFDVASLTKALVTTTLTMQQIAAGRLSLDRKLSHLFQSYGTHGKERITIRHLLNHTSGYAATAPYYKEVSRADAEERAGMIASRGAVEYILSELFRGTLDAVPGSKTIYSDLGFILLGHALETIAGGVRLDKLAEKQIFQPLRLRSTAFIDLGRIRRRGLAPVTEQIVPTTRCAWRGRILCGEVHDDTAYVMGGVAGHAGLFSTAEDVHAIAAELIQCYHGRGSIVPRHVIRQFWQRDGMDPKSTWALGWDTPNETGSSAGRFFPPTAVGHLGFTGCSLWIDPERELDIVLLTNRVHPSADNQLIKEFRPVIHDLVMEALGYGV